MPGFHCPTCLAPLGGPDLPACPYCGSALAAPSSASGLHHPSRQEMEAIASAAIADSQAQRLQASRHAPAPEQARSGLETAEQAMETLSAIIGARR